ncbi:MAG TPA: hypothetical protein VGO93_19995, partial [Candidatus Xenobia bacterium]
SAALLGVLQVLGRNTFIQVSADTQAELDEFVNCFLFLMTRAEYEIRDRYATAMVNMNPLIGNVVALSGFKTTDAHLAVLGRQQNNLVKVLTLYSARNRMRIDRKKLFDINPTLTSLWYSIFFGIYHSTCVDEESWNHLREHVAYVDPRLTHLNQFHHMCFAASYIDPDRDRLLKYQVNTVLQGSLRRSQVARKDKPDPRRIAVITNRWFPSHSVFRNQATWLAALRPEYDLELFHLGPLHPDTDRSLFSAVHEVSIKEGKLDVSPLMGNDFAMAYYPEVGMCMESIMLSNVRVAPIQVTSYGHSVSTFGSDIDYWIGSAEVELPEELSNNYSERVVLLPGLGIANLKPAYELQNKPIRQDRLVVNCSWYPQKVNWPLVGMMKRVLERSPRHVLLRFFSGGGLMEVNHFLPFVRSLQGALGADRIEVLPGLNYQKYMTAMEEGALSLDAYHYGGCNTVVDSLHIRRPIATLSGTKWYNRIGGGILRKAGFPELVAETKEAFIDLCVRLINDTAWREDLTARMKATDIDSRLYDRPEDGRHFKQAIDYLIAHHPELKQQGSKQPIQPILVS